MKKQDLLIPLAMLALGIGVGLWASRRANDPAHTGGKVGTLAGVQHDLQARDKSDSERPVAPLTMARDAEYIDTTGMSIDDVVERVLRLVREKLSLG